MGYEIREMSFAEVLDTGFKLLRNHFALLVGMAAIVYVPMAVVAATLQDPGAPAPDTLGAIGVMVGGFFVGALLTMVGTTIVFAAVTWSVGQVYLGRPVSAAEALRHGVQRLLPLFGTSFLSILFVMIGTLMLILPGIYLMLGYLLLWPIMLIEDTFGMRALRRSRELMRGHMGRGLGIAVLMWLISVVVTSGLDFAFGAVPLLGPLASGIGQAFAGAYGSAVLVVLYFDSRCRLEAFDLEHLAAQVSERAALA
jgi:hypothetical protein